MGISFNPRPVHVVHFDGDNVERFFAGLHAQFPRLQLVIAVLGRKGYGVSYGAWNRVYDSAVKVKECMQLQWSDIVKPGREVKRND